MTGRSLGPPLHLVSPREPWERTLGETPRSARRLFAEPERAGSQGSSAALFSPPSARIGREAPGAGVAPSALRAQRAPLAAGSVWPASPSGDRGRRRRAALDQARGRNPARPWI